MKFKTLKGNIVIKQLSSVRFPLKTRDKCKSESQYLLGRLIQKTFPGYSIYEEFSIPESRLSLDFFIPVLKLVFEYDGIQHFKFNTFFHKNKKAFERQQERDRLKEEWCKLNDFLLIRVSNFDIDLKELIHAKRRG